MKTSRRLGKRDSLACMLINVYARAGFIRNWAKTFPAGER